MLCKSNLEENPIVAILDIFVCVSVCVFCSVWKMYILVFIVQRRQRDYTHKGTEFLQVPFTQPFQKYFMEIFGNLFLNFIQTFNQMFNVHAYRGGKNAVNQKVFLNNRF